MQRREFIEPLFNKIQSLVNMPEEVLHYCMQFLEYQELKKGDFFITPGETAKYLAFTASGYLRVYYDLRGDEITRDITPLHSFATALPSFIHRKPSVEGIQAITDASILIISEENLQKLFAFDAKWERLGRRIVEDMFVEAQERLYYFISENAETRYIYLMKRYPDMLLHVPLQYIASYLGVTSQSLSRLRKKYTLKS